MVISVYCRSKIQKLVFRADSDSVWGLFSAVFSRYKGNLVDLRPTNPVQICKNLPRQNQTTPAIAPRSLLLDLSCNESVSRPVPKRQNTDLNSWELRLRPGFRRSRQTRNKPNLSCRSPCQCTE